MQTFLRKYACVKACAILLFFSTDANSEVIIDSGTFWSDGTSDLGSLRQGTFSADISIQATGNYETGSNPNIVRPGTVGNATFTPNAGDFGELSPNVLSINWTEVYLGSGDFQNLTWNERVLAPSSGPLGSLSMNIDYDSGWFLGDSATDRIEFEYTLKTIANTQQTEPEGNWTDAVSDFLDRAYGWLRSIVADDDYDPCMQNCGVIDGGGVRGSLEEVPGWALTTASPAALAFTDVDFSELLDESAYVPFAITEVSSPGDFISMTYNNEIFFYQSIDKFEIDKLYAAELPYDLISAGGESGNIGIMIESSGAAGNQVFIAGGIPSNAPAVPEPATWMMMLLGFGLIGGAMRHRSLQHNAGRYAF